MRRVKRSLTNYLKKFAHFYPKTLKLCTIRYVKFKKKHFLLLGFLGWWGVLVGFWNPLLLQTIRSTCSFFI